MSDLEVLVDGGYDGMSKRAAEKVIRALKEFKPSKEKPYFVLGLATGGSVEGLYDLLVKAENENEISFENVITFNLDEYIGLEKGHKESYRQFMEDNLFGRLNKRPKETYFPEMLFSNELTGGIETRELEIILRDDLNYYKEGEDGKGQAIVISRRTKILNLKEVRNALDSYISKIKNAGGIDLQILGVGVDGHIGFHEAGIPFELGNGEYDTEMLLVKLDISTRNKAVEDGYFENLDDVPKYAFSMGVDLIMKAKELLVLASGERKAKAVARSFNGLSLGVPLSAVVEYENTIYILDYEAASLIRRPYKMSF